MIPKGYRDACETGNLEAMDPNLARYYERGRLIVHGPLLSTQRLRTLWALWTGQYDHLLAAYLAANPKRCAGHQPVVIR